MPNLRTRARVCWICCLTLLAFTATAVAEEPPSLEAIAERTVDLVNQEREKQSLTAYKPSDELTELAREHARKIAAGEVEFGHAGFEQRQARIFAALGANHAAENVGWNNKPADATAAEAVAKWMRSKEHRGHVLGPFVWAGAGVARSESGTYYYTLLMAGPWPLPGK